MRPARHDSQLNGWRGEGPAGDLGSRNTEIRPGKPPRPPDAHAAAFHAGRYHWLTLIAADNELSSAAVRVAIIIFQRMNKEKGYAWPSIQHISEHTDAHR